MTRSDLRYRAWRYRLLRDADVIRWMRCALAPGDTALDIGAHKGAYTYWMRRSVGAGGAVYAFEPQPLLADYLCGAVAAFGWENVHVAPVGLSSEAGERTLYVPGGRPSPGASFVEASLTGPAQEVPTQVETLDGWAERQGLLGPIRFIKCDVEGHELDVFKGARGVLTEHRPDLLFECEARHDPDRSIDEVFAYLAELGYRGHFHWGGRLFGVEDFDAEAHQVPGGGEYVNDFVFRQGG